MYEGLFEMLRRVQAAFRKGSFNRRRIINCPDKSFWGVIWRETFVKFHRRKAVRVTKTRRG